MRGRAYSTARAGRDSGIDRFPRTCAVRRARAIAPGGETGVVKTPHVIHPNAVFGKQALRDLLGVTDNTLAREIRLGRLRVSKRAGRYFFLGKWVLEWLELGEVRRAEIAEGAT